MPEPTPASSAGPAANIPLPAKPALADKNTKAGLEAFTKWWFDLFSYGYATNDWKKFWAVTEAECRTCTNVVSAVDGIYKAGGWVEGGEASLRQFSSKFVHNSSGSITTAVTVRQSAITEYDENGRIVGESLARNSTTDVVIAFYADDHWVMLDYGKPPKT